MIIFEVNEKEYKVPNKPKEVTLAQVGECARLMQKGDFIDRWLNVLAYLGGKEIADKVDDEGLMNFIENFYIGKMSTKITDTIEVDGKTYKCDVKEDGELKLSARDMQLCESLILKEKEWATLIFAVVYKDTSMTSQDHKNIGHIKKKASIFGEQINGEIGSPVIFQISNRIIKNIDQLSKLAKS